MQNYLENKAQYISQIALELSVQNNNKTSEKMSVDKWSANEILGHLIDSAINNQRRFVLMQMQDNMIFDGYDQNIWVSLQNYEHREWNDLVNAWLAINSNIISCLKNIQSDLWGKKFNRHNLHKIAWITVPENQPVSIEYFVKDYFGHINHHLKQIEKLLALKLNLDN